MTTLTGTLINQEYLIKRRLGGGNFGDVYEAEQLLKGEVISTCALKVLRADQLDPRQEKLVFDEIRTLTSNPHPHLITYRTSGEITNPELKGRMFLVME